MSFKRKILFIWNLGGGGEGRGVAAIEAVLKSRSIQKYKRNKAMENPDKCSLKAKIRRMNQGK